MSLTADRNRRVEALLREAGGRWVTRKEIERVAGYPTTVHNILNVLRQHRPTLQIECQPGVGWRLAGENAEGIPPRHAISEPARKMMDLLEQRLGEFVPGREIAAYAHALVDQLSTHAANIRRRRPDLAIDAQRGYGFRARLASDPYTPPIGSARPPAPPSISQHAKMRCVSELLDLLTPVAAEQIKTVALESGESVDEALARLVNYGHAVHVDLVVSGENPIGLRRQTSGLMQQVAA